MKPPRGVALSHTKAQIMSPRTWKGRVLPCKLSGKRTLSSKCKNHMRQGLYRTRKSSVLTRCVKLHVKFKTLSRKMNKRSFSNRWREASQSYNNSLQPWARELLALGHLKMVVAPHCGNHQGHSPRLRMVQLRINQGLKPLMMRPLSIQRWDQRYINLRSK